jgi:hypothetical protein
MNADLIFMFGAVVLLGISGLLVFCFTEAKGKNTPHARKNSRNSAANKNNPIAKSVNENNDQRDVVTH